MILRYSRPDMRAIWTDENKLKIWLQIELLASEALVKEGIVPKSDFAKMKRGAEKCFGDYLLGQRHGYHYRKDHLRRDMYGQEDQGV